MKQCFKCKKEQEDMQYIEYDDVYCCDECYSKYSYMCSTCTTISVVDESMWQVGYKHICRKCRQ